MAFWLITTQDYSLPLNTFSNMPEDEVKTAKCGSCGATREIQPKEIEPGEMPICDCGDIMFPVEKEPEEGEL